MNTTRLIVACSLIMLGISIEACDQDVKPAGGVENVPDGVRSSYFIETKRAHADRVIIFISGVFGDPVKTWSQGNVYWPQLLHDDPEFSSYDVYVVSYNSPMLKFSSNINEIATRVSQQIETDILQRGYKQIHFITHSMGGLIAKRILVMLNRLDQSRNLRRVRSVLFFGTPSQGAEITQVAKWLSANPQIKDMDPIDLNTFVQVLEDDWQSLLRTRDERRAQFPQAYCAYERQATYVAFVVGRSESATRCDKPPYPIELSHIEIVKPVSRAVDPYRWASDRLLEAAAMKGPAWQRVVIMDSAAKEVVYDPGGFKKGETNADAIIRVLGDLPIVTIKELTHPDWMGDTRVRALDPDLIIIHLSCFYTQTNPLDSDQKFRSFVEVMAKNSQAKFLVYTRPIIPSIATPELQQRWFAQMGFLDREDLRERIDFMAVPRDDRRRFDHPTTARELHHHVEALLGL